MVIGVGSGPARIGTVLDGTVLDGTVLDGTVLDGVVLNGGKNRVVQARTVRKDAGPVTVVVRQRGVSGESLAADLIVPA